MGRLIDDFVRNWRASPESILLETPDGATMTRAEMDRLSAQMAAVLAASGAQPGDRIAAQTAKSPQALALYLACLRGGHVYLPLNPGYTDSEIAYFLADAEPAVAVMDPSRPDFARTSTRTVLTLDDRGHGSLVDKADAAHAAADHAGAPAELAALLYTSGTTGRPKGAMLSHANLHANAHVLAEAWRMSSGDVLLHALPIFHAHGLFVAVHLSLLAGAPMLFHPAFEVDAVLRDLRRATVFMGVPTHYARLLDGEALSRERVASVRLFVSGSAPLTPEAFSAFERRTGHRILERYGMTETVMLTSNPYDGSRQAGTVGPALPGVDVRVVNDTGEGVLVGTVGDVEVRGPSVFAGYWRAQEKTAESFREGGWFRTGDVGRLDGDGRLTLVGRSKDIIISGGFNVYPREVEDVLLEMAGVADAAVFGVPHPDWGEAVVAAIETGPSRQISEVELVAHARSQLATYKAPRRVLIVDRLPRNAMGKVEKAKLRAAHAGMFADVSRQPAR